MTKAIVIGSGIGGAAVAGLLAQKGLEVTLFERNSFPGGKAGSYERDGFVFDIGVHYSLLGERGPLGIVARRLNANVSFLTHDPCIKLVWGDRSYDVPKRFKGIIPLLKVSALLGLKPFNLVKNGLLMRKMVSAQSVKDVEPYYETTLKDFVEKYTDDTELHNLLYLLCGIMLAVPPDVASTGEFMWGLSSFLGAESPAYPKGGFGMIPKAYIDAMARFGGQARFNEGAKRIIVENGRVTGVQTTKGVYPADVVVSNAGLRNTLALAGKEHFPAPYEKRASGYVDSYGGITIKYGLSCQPTDVPLTFYCPKNFNVEAFLGPMSRGNVPDEDPPLYIPAPSVIDPSLAPEGKHVLLVGTMVPNKLDDQAQVQRLISKVDQKTMALFPHLRGHIEFKHTTDLRYMANICGRETGDVIGIGQRFDQAGKNKPDARMPVQGLYLVGCDAGGNGVGTEQAANSAINVCEMVLTDVGARTRLS